MFPAPEDGGGHGDERRNRAALVPARGGGGGGVADGDSDGDEPRARQPGCFLGWPPSWRRRRARIAATTGDMAVKDLPPHEMIAAVPSHPHELIAAVPSHPHEMIAAVPSHPHELIAEVPSQRRVSIDAMTSDIATHAQELTELPSEVDGLIVSKLLSLTDRCVLQGVSRRWRSATRDCVSPPLPLIVNADLTMVNCFAEGLQAVPLKVNSQVPQPTGRHQVTCLGSLDSFIILAYDEWNPQNNLELPHTSCLLVQPVNGSIFDLPDPCSFEVERGVSGSVQVIGADGSLFTFYQPVKSCALRLKKAIMSHSSNPKDCIVAGLATQRGAQHVVFTTPRMSCWYICSADFITVGADIEVLEDKIIILGTNQEELFQIDFGRDFSFFPIPCEIKRCLVIDLPQLDDTQQQLNLVRAGGELMVVARYFTLNWDQLTAVRVFQLDTVTWTLKRIHSLGERCVLVSLSCSQSIAAAASGQIDPRADHIYFLDLFCPHFFPGEDDDFSYRAQVYSMRDGTVNQLLIGSGRGSHRPGFPMWFFPSE